MAIKIYKQFAPFANPADGDHPYGSFKNDSIPGAEDGTPLDAVWANDLVGFTDALLADAGIAPSGQPDKLGASQRVDAIKKTTLNSFLPATLSARLVNPLAFEGLVVDVQDRPEAKFKYVLAGSVNIDGYNIIQCSAPIATLALQRINYQITDLHGETVFGSELQNLNVVITGDSLSFNGYGYPAGWGVTGAGYATDQWFGLSSWSHLVRDFIVSSNPAFKSIFDLNWYSSGVVARGISDADKRYFGMNGRVITFNFTNSTSKVIIEANSGLPIGLLVSTALKAFAYKFSVDGVEYDNVTDYPDNYLGGGYKVIPCGAEPVITNVRRFTTLAPGGEFSIYGVTSRQANAASSAKFPMITGKGGYKSAQVLAEYNTLVKPYLPDVVFYMIGANDIDAGVSVSSFKSNIAQFVDLVRADSPNAKIILLTTTPVARPPWVEGQERPYIQAMQDVCDDKYCQLINVYDEFRNIDPFYWRFDNTHFNKRGDSMMFNLIKDKIFPSLPIDSNKFTPVREFYSGLLGLDGKRDMITNSIEVTCAAGTPTISAQQNGNFKALCRASYLNDGGYLILRVTFPDDYALSSAETMHTNAADNTDILKVRNATANYVDIFRVIGSAGATIDGSNNKIRLSAGRLFNRV